MATISLSSLEFRPALNEDSSGILKLLQHSAQQSRITINFEREPDYFFGAAVSCETPEIWVATLPEDESAPEAARKIVGVSAIGSRRQFINEEIRDIRYIHDLRIASEYQGTLLLFKSFRKFKTIFGDDWATTTILSENSKSIETVGSGRAGLPIYYPYGNINTYLLERPKLFHTIAATDWQIRRARQDDISQMQTFFDREARHQQFFPYYQFSEINGTNPYYRNIKIENFWLAIRQGEIIGMLGSWDQKSFKQTRALAYNSLVGVLRPIYNLYCQLFGGSYLPVRGGIFNYHMAHCFVVKDNETAVLSNLIRAALADTRSQRALLVISFFDDNMLSKACSDFLHTTIKSQHFLVSYKEDPRQFINNNQAKYVEVARL